MTSDLRHYLCSDCGGRVGVEETRYDRESDEAPNGSCFVYAWKCAACSRQFGDEFRLVEYLPPWEQYDRERKSYDPPDLDLPLWRDQVAGEEAKVKARSPKVFISYSWDSDRHREWVSQLATRLRADYIDVVIDDWNLRPGDHLPQFMETAVRESDFVLLVCTPQYQEKANQRIGGLATRAASSRLNFIRNGTNVSLSRCFAREIGRRRHPRQSSENTT